MMTQRDRAFERARKVYELFTRGVDGERESARLAFERICSQYDFTEEDFNDEVVGEFVVRYKNQMEMKLVCQIASMCRGTLGSFTFRPRRRELVLKLARKDYINAMIHVDMLLPHFRREFERGMRKFRERLKFWCDEDIIADYGADTCIEARKEVKADVMKFRRHFAVAFIMAHDIYPPQDENGECRWEDDEDEFGRKLLGKDDGRRRRRWDSFDEEAWRLSGDIDRMEVRTRITNGELSA